MSWKNGIQIRDLDADQKLEFTCLKCGHVHSQTPAQVMCSPEREFLYLDEIEKETTCKARGCRGAVRLALIRNRDTSAFVGGMA